jgi:hypothetical protein
MSAMKKHSLLLSILALSVTASSAQTDGNTPGGEYYINSVYNPVIGFVQKIDLRPESIDTVLPVTPMTYVMLPVKADVPARVDSIEAAKLNIQLAQQKLYKGFVKAGFGIYTTPLLELYYDQTRSRKNAYGLHYRHLSSNGGLSDVGPSDYSYNNVDGYYSAYLPHHEVGARFIYDRRRVSYYGYDLTDSLNNLQQQHAPPDDAVKQIYNDIGFALRLKSLYKDSTKLAHDVGLEVHTYGNLTGSRETNLKLTGDLSMEMGTETYGGRILIDNNAYRAVFGEGIKDVRTNGTLLGLEPFVSTKGDKYTVRVGAGMFLDSQGKTTFHFFPQAYLDYSLFDDILVPYIGVDGHRIRKGFRSLTQQNPWLGGAPNIANSSLMYDVYGGLRGSFSSDIGFDVRISNSRMKARPLFISAPYLVDSVTYGGRFGVVYDQVDQLDLSGELTYSHDEHLDITGRIDVFTYTTDQQAEAWNLPPYQLSLGARYDFRDKILLKLELQFLGARKAGYIDVPAGQETFAEVFPRTKDLDGYLDMHLGLEYRYTKRLSVFLDASNLSASKYERWYGYPVQRALVLGGATFAF